MTDQTPLQIARLAAFQASYIAYTYGDRDPVVKAQAELFRRWVQA